MYICINTHRDIRMYHIDVDVDVDIDVDIEVDIDVNIDVETDLGIEYLDFLT